MRGKGRQALYFKQDMKANYSHRHIQYYIKHIRRFCSSLEYNLFPSIHLSHYVPQPLVATVLFLRSANLYTKGHVIGVFCVWLTSLNLTISSLTHTPNSQSVFMSNILIHRRSYDRYVFVSDLFHLT